MTNLKFKNESEIKDFLGLKLHLFAAFAYAEWKNGLKESKGGFC